MDAISHPAYLTDEFFKKCLLQGLSLAHVNIINVKLSRGSNPGENFASLIYRAAVVYSCDQNSENVTISLIIKSIPRDGDGGFMEKNDVFHKEKEMYLNVLPFMDCQVAPRCLFITEEPMWTIVFEDLRAIGYTIPNRQIGLDEEHCIVVLKKIAQFHALSKSVLQKNPAIQQQFKDAVVNVENASTAIFQPFFRNNLKKAAEMVRDMPGYEHFAEKLTKFNDNFVSNVAKSVEFRSNNLVVLNHGDMWVNNMMFKYSSDVRDIPTDVIFLDYQMCYVNSLAMDLNYFFTTSAQLPILKRKKEFITKYYYPVFERTLRETGHESIPTLAEILEEINQRESFSLINLFGELPLFLIDEKDSITSDYAEFSKNEELAAKTRNAGMSTARFIETMKYCLKHFEENNVF